MLIFNKLTKFKIVLGASIFLFSAFGCASSATTQFTAQIAYEGACEISVPSSVTFNNGEAILPSQIEAKAAVAKQVFNLTLTKCQGIKVTPKIVVTGNVNSDSGQELFLDVATSTAVGYGILLQTQGNTTFQENLNLAKNKTISAVKNWNVETSLTTINGTLPLSATLTCTNCTDDRVGGELKASVTFDFQYE